MSIRVGLYDFFAYTIPGGLYLFTITYLGIILGWIKIDFQVFNNLSVMQVSVLIALAYITGMILEPIAKQWQRIFKSKGISQKVLDGFKEKHADLDIRFRAWDWAVLLAYLRRENIDVAVEIERHKVTSIMLRNVSLSLILLAVIHIVEFIRTNFVWYLVLFAALVFASIMAGRESTKFQAWFYSTIYEAITARSLEASDLVVRKQDNIPTEVSSAKAVTPAITSRPTSAP
jgi:hypothetical protein